MKIRILSEKKVVPLRLKNLIDNPDFYDLRLPNSTKGCVKDTELKVLLHEQAHQSMWKHGESDLENELGGALIGFYALDENDQEIAIITDVFNQPVSYYAAATSLRFTKQFYNELGLYIDQISESFPEIVRLGLYHTHPNYGVFLSETDAKTFKGIFKASYQVTMVVDPIKKEEGVFYWVNNDLSERACFQVFKSRNSQFSSHKACIENTELSACNFQIYTAKEAESIPELKPIIKRPKISLGQQFNEVKITSDVSPKLSLKSHFVSPEFKLNSFDTSENTGKREVLSWKDFAAQIPKDCPLYDVRYKNVAVNLKRYTKSINREQVVYPYMVFVEEGLKKQLEQLSALQNEVLVVLRGQFCVDKKQQQSFNFVYDMLVVEKTIDDLPFDALKNAYLAYQQTTEVNDVVGWMYISNQLTMPTYHFFDAHRKVFNNSDMLGIILIKQHNETLDFEDMMLVGHEAEKNVPYDYFKHFFFYSKLYP